MGQSTTERRRRAAAYIAVWTAAVLLLTLILYQALGLGTVRAQTVAAVKAVEYSVARPEGYIFRDEQVLYSDNTGAAVYLVSNGARVRADTELCRVYTNGSTDEYLEQRDALEERLALLEEAMALGQNTAGGIDRTAAALERAYAALMSALEDGRLDEATDSRRELLVALSARGLINGDSLDEEYAATVQALSALNAAYSGSYDSLRSTAGSYFFYDCDGYEEAFDISLIDTVSAQTLRSLAAAEPEYSGAGVPVGKLVNSYEWYLALAADADVIAQITVGRSYTVELEGYELEMTAYRADSAAGVIVLSCGIMPEGFEYGRVQSVRLILGSLTGYRVPEQALHTREGFDGVYVLSGSEVIFRRVTILRRSGGYALVAERDYSTENYSEFLELNDQIIISLSDGELYDGRILD